MAKRKSNQSFQGRSGQLNNNNSNNRMNNPGLNRLKTNAQSVSAVNKGASSGLKTKNKYLQDFEKLKAGYNNKKGDKYKSDYMSVSCLYIYTHMNERLYIEMYI
jgi:hypothetical protein